MPNDRYGELLRNPKIASELCDLEDWLSKYGEQLIAYEPSRIVTRTAWVARIALDEAYKAFPGEEQQVRDFVAEVLKEKLQQLNVPVGAVTSGDLHGTRQDVVEVLRRIFPNLAQTERPSLPVILRQEERGPPQPALLQPQPPARNYLSKYIYAWVATLLASAILILLLTRALK
ncbi:MAG: hypothetical protein LM590_02000 [Thermofilum sp.]|jgi:hypothetical protein|nr:hypothetical protein [Thermofilum sp.]